MESLSAVQTIPLSDVINMTKDVASLNATYLTITVSIILAVLTILVGVFYFFNFRPLKDSIDKQEKDLAKRLKDNEDSAKTLHEAMQEDISRYKEEVSKQFGSSLTDTQNTLLLEVKKTLAESESALLERMNTLVDSKDASLRELITAEVSDKQSKLEVNLKAAIDTSKTKLETSISVIENKILKLASDLKDQKVDITEVQRYMYSQQGKMGAIYNSIELLDDAIGRQSSWRIAGRLGELNKEIKGVYLKPDDIRRIEAQLIKIENDKQYAMLIATVRKTLVDCQEPASPPTPASPAPALTPPSPSTTPPQV